MLNKLDGNSKVPNKIKVSHNDKKFLQQVSKNLSQNQILNSKQSSKLQCKNSKVNFSN